MRALLVILLLANAGFAAWAAFVDGPAESPAARDISGLPRLVLTHEADHGGAPKSGPPHGSVQPTAALSSAPAEPQRCVTVGPFDELDRAAAAAALLKNRGFAPRQRDERGEDLVQYWVFVGGFNSDAAEDRALKQLRAKGLSDVQAMPPGLQGRRLSLGLFTEHARAEHRAREVRAPGVTPQIEEQRRPQATYWVDLSLQSQEQAVPTDGLLPEGVQDAHLEIRTCPAAAPVHAAAAGGTAPVATPGSAPAPAV